MILVNRSEEAALYDRQLRLWGSVAQSRIRQCRAIIAPFQGGVAVEAAKNLILAGVRELILVDDGLVEGGSLTASFAWREADVGQSVRYFGSTWRKKCAHLYIFGLTANRSGFAPLVVSEPSRHHHHGVQTSLCTNTNGSSH